MITKAVDPIRSDFEEMNTIRGFNLKRKDKALDLAFKMAAMDVLWDTKLYRSKFCEFDLYYLGEDLFDIPKGTPNFYIISKIWKYYYHYKKSLQNLVGMNLYFEIQIIILWNILNL